MNVTEILQQHARQYPEWVSITDRVGRKVRKTTFAEFDEAVYDEQVGMMEMVLDVDDIVSEMQAIRDQL